MAKLKIRKTMSDEVVMLRNGDDIWIISTRDGGGISIELCSRAEEGKGVPRMGGKDILIGAKDEEVMLVSEMVFLSRATAAEGEEFAEAPVAHP